MWNKEYLQFNNGYNEYELLWLWYYYHSEKFDSKLAGMPSSNDDSSNRPFHHHMHESNTKARELRKQMKYIVGGDTYILDSFKNTFSRYKTKNIYELYELLDKKGKFEFINVRLKELERRKINIDYRIFQ